MHFPNRAFRRLLALLAIGLSGFARAELSWIWASNPDLTPVQLRREFTLETLPREAVLHVTCDNGARIVLNGEPVATCEDWNSPVKVDLTRLLKTGPNELRAEALNEGGPAGLAARLVLRLRGNREQVIDTDAAWEVLPRDASSWQAATVVARYGEDPWGDALGLASGRALVVQPADIEVLPGFRVDLIHVVPKGDAGSWVSMTVDPQGRIIACDQYGALYRLTPPPLDSDAAPAIEKLQTRVGGAHGLLYAFDSLYVMVNEQGDRQGLWRLRDLDGDGQFEQEQLLRRIQGGGEHGTHAVVLSPDRQSLHIVCGNHTKLPEGMELSRAPRAWDEDQILPRLWDANGHARGILAPGGYICRTDPDGRTFELVSAGYRNAYDLAFTGLGDIITYDSDMEWDAGLPWYRPTRINLATSGSEFGWRSGSGKWPDYYPDSLPALLDIGPGSPTGVESGAGSRFPARYQHAIFANDWTYGTMYAIHLVPDGAGYRASREEFVSGKPLPLTDLTVNPHDGALYFAIGGRRTQSAVYRVVYTGSESTAPAPAPALQAPAAHQLRRQLESLHRDGTGPEAVSQAWPHLGHRDRWVRFAARVAIERQPAAAWTERVFTESRPVAAIEAAIALARVGPAGYRDALLARLHQLDVATLDHAAQLALLRAYQLACIRMGHPTGAARDTLIARLDRLFPAATRELNRELANLLLALDAPTAVPKTLQLLATARDEDVRYASDALLARNTGYASAFSKAASSRPNQQQIAYAYALRVAKSGWTPALRRAFFDWFPRTAAWEGGNSFRGFLEIIRKEALANVTDPAERAALDELSSRRPDTAEVAVFPPPKGPGRDYSLDDILAFATTPLRQRDFNDGRRLYHAAACYSCHRFNGSGGGAGPDLTESGSRFSLRDLLENIVEPSKVISDQYGSELVELANGATLIGRAYAEGDRLVVIYDPRNPDEKESAPLAEVKSRKPYPVSLMPQGLLNAMNEEEILNLLAYILSAGNPEHPAFAR